VSDCPIHWSIAVIAEPDDEPITPEQLQELARVLVADQEPGLMDGYIKAARQHVERDTGLALITQSVSVGFDRLPTGQPVDLPIAPVQGVEGFSYFDTSGDPHELDATAYAVDIDSRPARIALLTVPPDARAFQAYALRLTVGFGDAPDDVPAPLVHAVGLLATHYLQAGRDPLVIGTIVAPMPFGYDDDVQPYRLVTIA
jgi:uncharacterized phiE125 gp8 family phage protein